MIRLAIDEARKSETHGFERRPRCDRARQLKRLLIIPKRRIPMDK